MINTYSFRYNSLLLAILAVIVAVMPLRLDALPLEHYAANSVLATGSWAKVSVHKSGVYILTNSALRSMGFHDPSKVKIFGYGAKRISERLDDTYIDDLPVVQSILTSRGIIFYAKGPDGFESNTGSTLTPTTHPYVTEGLYFISDRDAEGRAPVDEPCAAAENPETTFTEISFIKQENVSPGMTGTLLLGDDFRYNSTRKYTLALPDAADPAMKLICSFAARSTENTYLTFSVNNEQLQKASRDFVPMTSDKEVHFRLVTIDKSFNNASDKATVGISISTSGTLKTANLNFLAVNYSRHLKLGNSPLSFRLSQNSAILAGADANTLVWDVTDPMNIRRMQAAAGPQGVQWNNPYSGQREYIAFNPAGALPEPAFVGRVKNQDLHSVEVPDMVIFTPAEWRDQAQRLANLHATGPNPLKVLVVDQREVFNEFASGAADPQAFRKMLKMLYDRSTDDVKLQYALFFGRGIYDNRALVPGVKALNFPRMPIWESSASGSDTESFTTDDIFAFLKDGSGLNVGYDNYCIAVGRLPVTSASAARKAVDKIIDYQTRQPRTGWRSQMLFLVDDGDKGIHVDQAEEVHQAMLASNGGKEISYNKIYLDAYELIGGVYVQAREELFKQFDEGVAWWMYIGHANTTSLTSEKVLTYDDINNLYLRHYPIVVAATCDFLRWDGINISAAEIMWGLENGGCIAAISANRPVYIADNGNLTKAFGQEMFRRDADGNRQTIGQIYMNAKNRVRGDTNKLRYVLMGDPAMMPIVPNEKIVLTSINGIEPGSGEDPVIMARQNVTMEGFVADTAGNILEDFNGAVSSTLYDAEHSVTTLGNSSGAQRTFEQQGSRIFAGNDEVKNGRFTVNVAMPSAISDNYRPAAIRLYAYPTDKNDPRQGGTVNRDFYVFGTDNDVIDTEAPVIESIYMNHPKFKNGDKVNTSPMLIAKITDNRGINMSSAGIGHQMSLMLDDRVHYANVCDYFTPEASDKAAGTISFPIENLRPGRHSARLRVWDTSDNSAVETVDFIVDAEEMPTLYDIYADANPASTSTNFYLVHDRPDAMVEVKIAVYNLMGKEVWSTTTAGRSDMCLSQPVNWNLTDHANRRVARGIYLYRATITADGVQSATKTKRIAVTGGVN